MNAGLFLHSPAPAHALHSDGFSHVSTGGASPDSPTSGGFGPPFGPPPAFAHVFSQFCRMYSMCSDVGAQYPIFDQAAQCSGSPVDPAEFALMQEKELAHARI